MGLLIQIDSHSIRVEIHIVLNYVIFPSEWGDEVDSYLNYPNNCLL